MGVSKTIRLISSPKNAASLILLLKRTLPSKKNVKVNNYILNIFRQNTSFFKLFINVLYCFFNDLYFYEKNIFICDFDNKDYFWLDKVMKKNRQNDFIIVK